MLTMRGRSWPTDTSREERVEEEGVWRAWQKKESVISVAQVGTCRSHRISTFSVLRSLWGHGASLVATGLCCSALHTLGMLHDPWGRANWHPTLLPPHSPGFNVGHM